MGSTAWDAVADWLLDNIQLHKQSKKEKKRKSREPRSTASLFANSFGTMGLKTEGFFLKTNK